MAWLKVDERFFESRVALDNPAAAVMYLRALLYCMTFNLDAVPKIALLRGGGAAEDRALAHLIDCGVFRPTGEGYTIEHVWVEDKVYIEPASAEFNSEFIERARHNQAQECVGCGATKGLAVDHIVPRSRGGQTKPNNLQILCTTCNSIKGSKVPWGALDQRGSGKRRR